MGRVAGAREARRRATALRDLEHAGFAAIEIVHTGARLVVVHGTGPRIAWFGVEGGRNLLYWDEASVHERGAWKLRGGHRIWVTRPLADETEEAYEPDNEACSVRRAGGAIVITAPRGAQGLEKSLAIRPLADGSFQVDNVVRNRSDMLWSGGVWALTCSRPGRRTRYVVPFGRTSPPWDVVTLVVPRSWGGGHTSRLDDPQVVLGEDELVLVPAGRECKRMVQAAPGTIAMTDPDEGLAFVKQAAFEPGGRYPLACNLALYLGADSFMAEMETMGPERTLLPGQALVHRERWSLADADEWPAGGSRGGRIRRAPRRS